MSLDDYQTEMVKKGLSKDADYSVELKKFQKQSAEDAQFKEAVNAKV